MLTGKDDDEFCHRVSKSIASGYRLYGSPAATCNGEYVVVAQAARIAIAEGLHAQALMQRADGQCGMGGSLEAIDVAVVLHAGWPHPLVLTPSCCPAWGVMS